MDTSLDTKIREALQELDSLKSTDCLDDVVLGNYADNKVTDEERHQSEAHLHSCLYCLNRLNEMKELLYYQQHPVPVPDELVDRLQSLISLQKLQSEQVADAPVKSFGHRLRQLLAFPVTEWRYTAVGFAGAALAVLVCLSVLRPDNQPVPLPQLNPDAFVGITALGADGKVLHKAQGVVMDAKGYVASNLYSLYGASSVQVTKHDGKPLRVDKIWADENKNLAVMKLDIESLPAIPASNIKQLIGKSVYIVTDPAKANRGVTESIVSNLFQFPGRRSDQTVQYIQIANMTSHATGGALIDKQGKLVGLLITQDKNINMAAPIADVERLYKNGKAISLQELKQVTFSPEALDYYLKGVLARDSHQWQEAQLLLEKAVQLNPRLDGAYLELGYIFYRQRDYLNEARAYEAALAINPNNADALLSMAWNLDSRLKFSEAIAYYERAQLIEPDNPEIIFRLGLAFLAQGDKVQALTMATRLKELDPGNAELLRRLAR